MESRFVEPLQDEAIMVAEDFSLIGKIALITGSGRGLGLEIGKAFGRHGAHVLVNGRNLSNLQDAVSLINAEGGTAMPLVCDIADEDAVMSAFRKIQDTYGRLDILVNNVGMRDRKRLFDFELNTVRRLIDVNLLAPFNVSRAAGRMMVENSSGRIINVTSIAGPIANVGDAAYTAAKGGLEGLTRAFAAELGPSGITVNAVAQGFFTTETNKDLAADEKITSMLKRRTSLGRWGAPSEIAGAAVFLASPAASYITGQVLAVDGGFLTHF